MLTDLDLLPVYDSAEHDLVADLIVPLLMNSSSYIRGVGFFTSGWVSVAAQGIARFAEAGGRARFVVSPIMSPHDVEALALGTRARYDRVLHEVLSRSLTSLVDDMTSQTLNALAWLVADEVLDFRIAIPKPPFRQGDYHDKVGVCTDYLGNQVAFHGSLNDTLRGSLNGESFSVFKSWVAGQSDYVTIHNERIERLWQEGNNQFSIHEIPWAIRQGLMRLRSDERPYRVPQHQDGKGRAAHSAVGLTCPFPLRSYQEQAIRAWDCAGGQGILEMATGTGKTYTALGAAALKNNEAGRIAVIVEVPYLHLVDQWKAACDSFGLDVITCSGSHGRWQVRVAEAVHDFRIGVRSSIGIIVTHQTAAKERFLRALRGLDSASTMLIADEVHALGAAHLNAALLPDARMRLGLSATPERWFDPEGTSTIHGYFGGVCFEFPLHRAIEQGYLVPYDYRPILCHLDEQESDEYQRLSNIIRSLIANSGEADFREDGQLSNLLIQRARLVGSASAKLPLLLQQIQAMQRTAGEQGRELQHVLIYCAPGTHAKVLCAVSALGLRCHEFTHRVDANARQNVLDQFSSGDIQVLVAIRCLDEGVDVPATRTAFVLASTTNPRQFVQRRGRILRLFPGKSLAAVYDFLVVSGSSGTEQDALSRSLLRREMPRFAEFAKDAQNQFQSRRAIWDILDSRGMLHLLEKTPWEIYHELSRDEHDPAITGG